LPPHSVKTWCQKSGMGSVAATSAASPGNWPTACGPIAPVPARDLASDELDSWARPVMSSRRRSSRVFTRAHPILLPYWGPAVGLHFSAPGLREGGMGTCQRPARAAGSELCPKWPRSAPTSPSTNVLEPLWVDEVQGGRVGRETEFAQVSRLRRPGSGPRSTRRLVCPLCRRRGGRPSLPGRAPGLRSTSCQGWPWRP